MTASGTTVVPAEADSTGTSATTTESARGPRLEPVPGWDGLRGLAVLAVLVYHLGAPWLPGGFLGVSAFFTLSGFLITSLLLTEQRATGRIDLRHFWVRRARRLFPAIAVVLLAVLVAGRRYASAGQLDGLRGDTLATLGYVANWRYLVSGVDYGGVSLDPSPLLHTWSLAIEEQFYILFPLLVVGVLRIRRRGALPLAIGAALALSLAALALVGDEPMRVYYGTDVRAAEVLIGALGALVFHSSLRPQLAAACRWLVPAALIGLAWSWHSAVETSPLLGRGGLALHAVGFVVLIVAAAVPGPTARAASVWPLRQLGILSYGIYLIHWPVFLWLTPLRTGWSTTATNVARLVLTLGLALVCRYLVEEPVRRDRWPSRRYAPAVLAASAVALVAGAIAFTSPRPVAAELLTADAVGSTSGSIPVPTAGTTPPTVAARGTATADETAAPASTAPPSTVAPTTVPSRPPDPVTLLTPGPARLPGQPVQTLEPGSPPRIMVAGDSLALTLGYGLEDWAESTGLATLRNNGWLACGVLRGGDIRWVDGVVASIQESCSEWETARAKELAELQPHLVVVLNGLWEIVDRRLPGTDHWQHIGEPDFDARVKSELSTFSELMGSRGATVLWLTYPRPATHVMAGLAGPFAEEDPQRTERLNQLIGEVVAEHPGSYRLDLRTYMEARDGGELDLTRRPDGFHWTEETADLEAQWLGPLLVNLTLATSRG